MFVGLYTRCFSYIFLDTKKTFWQFSLQIHFGFIKIAYSEVQLMLYNTFTTEMYSIIIIIIV
jgi:hypothetical protein